MDMDGKDLENDQDVKRLSEDILNQEDSGN